MSEQYRGLDVTGRRVLVVGGAEPAVPAVVALVQAQAQVSVLADALAPVVDDLVQRGLVTHLPASLSDTVIRDFALVVTATGDPTLDAGVARSSEAAGVILSPAQRDSAAKESFTTDSSTTDSTGTNAKDHGRVVLVGGGPGDAGLLTVRATEELHRADVVVVDRLAPVGYLDRLAADVEIIDVSKIPRGRFTSQERINEILVAKAREGRAVVRLKGGDSFVFGRGMEEVLACQEAGVPVTVVPGVTSAVSVPELAGVPVTHRGLSQGFTVVSGHVAPDDPASTLDWAALARGGTTLVVLMGVHHLARIAVALADAGTPADTPVACIMDGGLASQRVVTTTVGELVRAGSPDGLRAPAVVVIGEVARFATGSHRQADDGRNES